MICKRFSSTQHDLKIVYTFMRLYFMIFSFFLRSRVINERRQNIIFIIFIKSTDTIFTERFMIYTLVNTQITKLKKINIIIIDYLTKILTGKLKIFSFRSILFDNNQKVNKVLTKMYVFRLINKFAIVGNVCKRKLK